MLAGIAHSGCKSLCYENIPLKDGEVCKYKR